MLKHIQWLILLFLLCSSIGFARVEYRQFDNPEQEQAYSNLIFELRCLVCQNQNIADSNADLAQDLRRQVYEMLRQGKSQQEIVDFMTQRYGDFVMYRPAFNIKTALLWLGPVAFVMIGLIVLIIISRRKKSTTEDNVLSTEKKAKISQLLEKGDES